MKNLKIISVFSLVFVSFLFVLSSCDPDTVPPNIYLLEANGNIVQESDTTVLLYSKFVDPGFLVEDNMTEVTNIITTTDVEDVLTFTPDGYVRRTGEFDITYTATDEAGNIATKAKAIRVGNISDPFVGSYELSRAQTQHAAGTTYTASLSVHTSTAGRVCFSKVYAQQINDETSSYKVYADLFSEDLNPIYSSYFGLLGKASDETIPFFEGLTYEQATDSILSFTQLRIAAQEFDDGLGNITTIAGKEENNQPLSRIKYLNGTKEISRIVLELNVTKDGVVDDLIEIYTPL